MKNRVELIQEKVSGRFSKAVQAGEVTLSSDGNIPKTADRILFVTGEITAGGTIEFFEKITRKAEGVTNFDTNKLSIGRNGVATAVTLEYGTLVAASNTLAFEQTIGAVEFNKEAPALVKNAVLTFEDDVKPLIKFPIYEIHNPNTTRTNDEKYRELGDLRLLKASTAFKCQIKFPETPGVTLDSASRHFVKLTIRVGETVKR